MKNKNDIFCIDLRQRFHLSSYQLIILYFMIIILIGAFLLSLPVSSAEGISTPFVDSLFTATSAACVTGLIVRPTALYWSYFGQSVILILILIGGLGVITVAASILMLLRQRMSVSFKGTIQEAVSAVNEGSIIKLIRTIWQGTAIIVTSGTILLMYPMVRDHGARGIWMAFFHSISAFCNAGFDLLGNEANAYQSLVSYRGDILVNVTVMLLIVLGGIGYLTWDDFKKHRFNIRKYRFESRVVLLMYALLIFIPAIFLFFFEFNNEPMKDRILLSLFQSVTTRTAGFNTADLPSVSESSILIMIMLMMTGGAPGSTAGGMKVTTVAVMAALLRSVFRQKNDTELMKRRIDKSIYRQSSTILSFYISLLLAGAIAIGTIDDISLIESLFETASAVGTVGLTMGITPCLSTASHLVLTFLMFLGRVGGMTLVYAAITSHGKKTSPYPVGKIAVG